MLSVEVIGNLGSDATIKDFGGQKFIAFSVAHTETFTSQDQRQERTTWVSCLKHGESGVFKYLKKGTRVFVRGDLSVKIYEGSSGPQVGLSCRVKELVLLGSNRAAEQPEETGVQDQAATPSYSNAMPGNTLFTEPNDDLPF